MGAETLEAESLSGTQSRPCAERHVAWAIEVVARRQSGLQAETVQRVARALADHAVDLARREAQVQQGDLRRPQLQVGQRSRRQAD